MDVDHEGAEAAFELKTLPDVPGPTNILGTPPEDVTRAPLLAVASPVTVLAAELYKS